MQKSPCTSPPVQDRGMRSNGTNLSKSAFQKELRTELCKNVEGVDAAVL